MIHLSVIVCCYNSQNLLGKTLAHLANQKTKDGIVYEVVLVDNNSTDQTALVAKEIWEQLQTTVPLRIFSEPQPGLSYARKTGVISSKGEIIIFCDDDNWLEEDYLQNAYNFMSKNLKIGALGGQSISVLENDKPNWWEKEKASYAVGKQAGTSGEITKRGYVWGAGIVLRKKDMLNLYTTGFVSLLPGRKGEILASGDDSEICKWIMLMGYKLWYLEDLHFKHYIPAKRLSVSYLEQLLEGHKQSQNLLNLYNWFFYSGVYKKINHLTSKEKIGYFKKAIKKYKKKDNEWQKVLQLAFGSSVKIHSDLHQIIKTYKRLNN